MLGYFSLALLVFIASFLLLPTTKMVNNVYYALLGLPALVVLLMRWRQLVRPAPELLLWGGLLAWYAVVGIWSGDGQYFKHILYIGLFVLLVGQLVNPEVFRSPLFARGLFWILGLYVLGSAVVYWATGRYAVGERVVWLPGRMTGPIYTSMWLACCFALALPTWWRERRWLECAGALALAVFCMAFVLQSRSGLFGIAALLGLTTVYLLAKKARHGWWLAAVLLLGGGLLLALREVPEVAGLINRADAGRFEIWQKLAGEWLNCGVWRGCGVQYKTQATFMGGQPIPHPHNIYLALGLYSGLVSLLLFLALIVQVLRRAWSRRDPWGLYLLVALLLLNFDGSKLVGNPDELWLLVLLPAALIGNARCVPARQSLERA